MSNLRMNLVLFLPPDGTSHLPLPILYSLCLDMFFPHSYTLCASIYTIHPSYLRSFPSPFVRSTFIPPLCTQFPHSSSVSALFPSCSPALSHPRSRILNICWEIHPGSKVILVYKNGDFPPRFFSFLTYQKFVFHNIYTAPSLVIVY